MQPHALCSDRDRGAVNTLNKTLTRSGHKRMCQPPTPLWCWDVDTEEVHTPGGVRCSTGVQREGSCAYPPALTLGGFLSSTHLQAKALSRTHTQTKANP